MSPTFGWLRRNGTASLWVCREAARRIAAVADFLVVTSEWRDLAFLFDELERHEVRGWKVAVDHRWWLAFEWAEGIGPVNLRLVE